MARRRIRTRRHARQQRELRVEKGGPRRGRRLPRSRPIGGVSRAVVDVDGILAILEADETRNRAVGEALPERLWPLELALRGRVVSTSQEAYGGRAAVGRGRRPRCGLARARGCLAARAARSGTSPVHPGRPCATQVARPSQMLQSGGPPSAQVHQERPRAPAPRRRSNRPGAARCFSRGRWRASNEEPQPPR